MTMNGYIVRQINENELDQLLALYKHLHPHDSPLPEKEELDELWSQIVANPMLHYFVIETTGQLVASCTLTVIPNLTRGTRPYALIENVVTHPSYRRQGLGTKILHAAQTCAWENNCYKIMLMTGSKRPETHCFYETAGFDRRAKTAFIIRD